jgi:hypothetical protein
MPTSFAIVKRWLDAVNSGVPELAVVACADDVELIGLRAAMRGRVRVIDWLVHAGFSAEPQRWFCGEDGQVVVEELARWENGEQRVIAAAFRTRDGKIARVERFATCDAALAAAGLTRDDQVRERP